MLSDTIADSITNEFVHDILHYTSPGSPVKYADGEEAAVRKAVALLKRVQLRHDSPTGQFEIDGKPGYLVSDDDLLSHFANQSTRGK